jgi:hypothetical protein
MQKNLFGEEHESLADTLIRLRIPDFITLALLMEKRGILTTFLKAAYASLGKHDYDQALLLLHADSSDHVASGFLYLSDLQADPYGRSQAQSLVTAMERLGFGAQKELDEREIRARTIQNFGTETHRVVRYIANQRFESGLHSKLSIFNRQLFEDRQQTFLEFDEPIGKPLTNLYPYAIARNGRVSEAHLKLIERHWQLMAKALSEHLSWHTQYLAALDSINELRFLLYPILGEHVSPHHTRCKPDAALGYLEMLELMTWAVALMWAAKQPVRPIFGEIPPIHRKYGLSGGLIDRITTIPNNRFSSGAIDRLCRATENTQLPSVGYAHSLVRSLTKANFGFRLGDYKCAVGDSPSGFSILRHTDIKKPCSKHLGQIGDYMALSHVDLRLTYGINDLWGNSVESDFTQGDLIYLFPEHSEPTIFSINFDLGEKRECFREIAEKLRTARSRGQLREKIGLIAFRLKQRLGGETVRRRLPHRDEPVLFSPHPDVLTRLTQELALPS